MLCWITSIFVQILSSGEDAISHQLQTRISYDFIQHPKFFRCSVSFVYLLSMFSICLNTKVRNSCTQSNGQSVTLDPTSGRLPLFSAANDAMMLKI